MSSHNDRHLRQSWQQSRQSGSSNTPATSTQTPSQSLQYTDDQLFDLEEIYRPRPGAASTGVARIFVLTGRKYGESVESLPVEVDLILRGNLGAPRDIASASIRATANNPWGQRRYNILNLQSIFTAKLRAYSRRQGDNDYLDLEWMVFNLGKRVRGFAHDLDWQDRDDFATAIAESGEYTDQQVNFVQYSLRLDEDE
ncbi:hypothetical protein F4779DRAFT_634034 [Xylariaceae sp. FL0662B]|nr:hypothetical protein F4779DRAFT_634034 [Xylariaceae sp. FL0662B]